MQNLNYRETFMFPDIGFQVFPVYALDKRGRICNFKEKVYPGPNSAKKYTRLKQLRHRSKQASMFDMLLNIGYFEGLGEVVREMPILIQNSKRPQGLDSGLFFLCDYYFANIKLAVELDSEYHDEEHDKLRDKYLFDTHGIKVFRMRNFQDPRVQRAKFPKLKELLMSYTNIPQQPEQLIFTTDLYEKLKSL